MANAAADEVAALLVSVPVAVALVVDWAVVAVFATEATDAMDEEAAARRLCRSACK